MTTLVGVEVRRLAARRLTRVLAVVLFAGIVAAPPLVDWAFRERARIERDADVERCVQARPPKVRDGVTMPTIADEVTSPRERTRLCADAIPARDGTFHLHEVDEILRPMGALLIIAGFLIGASAVGADWQAGFMATLLTWEGRRGRVFAAKLAAAAGTVLVAAALWQVLLTLALAPFAAARDATDATGAAWLRATAGLGLRVGAVAAAAAALGGAIAFIGRGTAAALGGVAAYVLVLESVLSSSFGPLRPWLVLDNAIVFVKGQFEGGPGGDVPGRTVVAAATILAVDLAVVLAVSAVTFRRRDVV
jgi:ABC-2 type transport system permease protein